MRTSPSWGRRSPPATKTTRRHACSPRRGEDAAAGHKDRAAHFMLPHRGEVTAAGHEGRATLARSPVVEKALAQATQA